MLVNMKDRFVTHDVCVANIRYIWSHNCM